MLTSSETLQETETRSPDCADAGALTWSITGKLTSAAFTAGNALKIKPPLKRMETTTRFIEVSVLTLGKMFLQVVHT
jgi:hypothetical protein